MRTAPSWFFCDKESPFYEKNREIVISVKKVSEWCILNHGIDFTLSCKIAIIIIAADDIR